MFAKPAFATCPVRIVTVGGGLFIAKKLGVDDLLVAFWISALNTALAFWAAIFYAGALIYFWSSKQIGHAGNTFWGIDKIVFGMTAGLVIFILAILADKTLRRAHNDKVVFYYQKVILLLVFLIASTFIFKFLLK